MKSWKTKDYSLWKVYNPTKNKTFYDMCFMERRGVFDDSVRPYLTFMLLKVYAIYLHNQNEKI